MIVCSISLDSVVEDAVDLILNILTPKPQTVGIMTYNTPSSRDWAGKIKREVEAAGIKMVYEQYVGYDVLDFSPYLTKLKYANPNVVVASLESNQFLAISKQIMDLGGWGDIQMIGFANALAAAKRSGAEGWIVISPWHPSKDDTESLKFKEDFEAANGKSPMPNHVYYLQHILGSNPCHLAGRHR